MEKIQRLIIGDGDLKLSTIADRAGIPRSTVNSWKKNGVCGMSLLHFAKWAGARHLSSDDVMEILSVIRRSI